MRSEIEKLLDEVWGSMRYDSEEATEAILQIVEEYIEKETPISIIRLKELRKNNSEDECWVWTGAVWGKYGTARIGVKAYAAHKLAYTYWIGAVPPGKQLDHLCRNTLCVNPKHLEPVTPKENVLRGESLSAKNARKTHCKRGHKLDDANTYMRPDGTRGCRNCINANHRKWLRNTKEAQAKGRADILKELGGGDE